MTIKRLARVLAVCLISTAAFAQTMAVPQKRAVAVQSIASAELQEILFRSFHMACTGTDFASFHFVTSKETYNVVYACFPYTCAADAKTCRVGCSASSECSAGTMCDKGHCVIPVPHCSEDGLTSVSPMGVDKCSPYSCNRASGTCQRDCRTTEDCASGFVCDITPRLCVHP